MPNCEEPPHYPPWCGCPSSSYAGAHPADDEKPQPHPEGDK